MYCSSFVSSSTFSIVISSLDFEDDEVVLFDDVKDALGLSSEEIFVILADVEDVVEVLDVLAASAFVNFGVLIVSVETFFCVEDFFASG